MSEDSKKEILAGLDRPLRIGTRQSPLAMAQAEMTANALLSTHGWRPDQVELVPMVASGDKILDRALADVGGKALWTKELDHALGNGDIDCSVHSMKDVETIRPEQFILAGMLERADIHDRLVGAESIEALAEGAIVGTASPRRKAQLLRQRPDLDIRLIRGNVQTRLQKIESGEFDATMLAAAGLNRLDMADVGVEISDEIMLPAPAQGAIGIEVQSGDRHVRHLIRAISAANTFRAVIAERLFLKQLTADCHSPVAALATIDGATAHLRAEILLPDGSECVEDSSTFDIGDVSAPAILADKLLGKASPALKAIFGR
ncbi:hydroxymethylbilane synthase [Parasphingorhabdus sp.]|uniref:hydroxymethylbilane synthase n=1 Tax=Parasphingorhabdus sp. TaxID=2709688 RepID=UPI0030010F55